MARSKSVPPQAPKRKRRGPRAWYYFFLVFVAIMTLGASTAVGIIIGYINSLPPIEQLENYEPPQVSVVLDSSGARQVAQFSTDERRQVVPYNEIPEHLREAFLAAEDDRFYDHYGVDLKGVIRAYLANRKAGAKTQGASTITMQLPRNIIKEEIGREKTWERKIKEMFLTFQIERRYSKDQILEFYMNHILLGYQSGGVYSAAQTYFNKKLDDLTIAECATLAGIPKGPTIYNPIANPERAQKRRDYIIERMASLGWITNDARDKAIAEPMGVSRTRTRSNISNSEYPYFVSSLARDLTASYHITQASLNTQGLIIRSTLDPQIQDIAQEGLKKGLVEVERKWTEKKPERYFEEAKAMPGSLEEGQRRLMKITSVMPDSVQVQFEDYTGEIALPEKLPYYEPEKVIKAGNWLDVKVKSLDQRKQRIAGELADTDKIQGSVFVVNVKTGEVLASVGGADYRDTDNAGQFNRAVQGGKPAGSTVKPFFYAAALRAGFGPQDMIVDEPVIYHYGNNQYKPRNYENRFFGPTTFIEALEHSRNVATVRLFEALNVKKAVASVAAFDPGVGSMSWQKKIRPELSACLGPQDMSAFELASAYFAFVNQGVARHPQFFKTITDRAGQTVVKQQARESIVLTPIQAAQIIYCLRQVVLGGTGKAEIGDALPSPPYPPVAGKTGTTNDSTDAWFVGFTPDLLIVVYIGFDNLRSLGPQMTGGKVAGPIWTDIFKKIFETRNDWAMNFDMPAGIEVVDICGSTGKRVSESCSRWDHSPIYRGVPYKRGAAPKEICDGVPRRPVIEPIGGSGEIMAKEGTVDSPPSSDSNPNADPNFGFKN